MSRLPIIAAPLRPRRMVSHQVSDDVRLPLRADEVIEIPQLLLLARADEVIE
jgi:hypothetical protein